MLHVDAPSGEDRYESTLELTVAHADSGETTTNAEHSGETTTPPDWLRQCGEPCSLFADRCGESQHCVPYVCDPTDAKWGTPICVAVGPRKVGQFCLPPWLGESDDHCGKDLVCWNNICRDRCAGTPQAPTCPDSRDRCVSDESQTLSVCLRSCLPFANPCPDDESCLPVPGVESNAFACLQPNPTATPKKVGDSCDYLNACAPGLVCKLHAAKADDDDELCSLGIGCCAQMCRLDRIPSDCADPRQTCTALAPFTNNSEFGYCRSTNPGR